VDDFVKNTIQYVVWAVSIVIGVLTGISHISKLRDKRVEDLRGDVADRDREITRLKEQLKSCTEEIRHKDWIIAQITERSIRGENVYRGLERRQRPGQGNDE
jgi:beta-lactamase regulating signal transducer with metallopeptidase domain